MLKRVFIGAAFVVIAVFLWRHMASFLVVNTARPADVIVVLGGGEGDLRYWSGVKLMQEGYAPRLILDVLDKGETFGNRDVDLAEAFLSRTTPGKSTICKVWRDSTYGEAQDLQSCLRDTGVKSVLVVTSAYHTRRALAILQQRLPQYQISIYPAPDPFFFGTRWWQNREWAKTTLSEWQRYLWWLFVVRWRGDADLRASTTSSAD